MCSLWNSANREELRKIFSSLIQKNFQVTKIILAFASLRSGYRQLQDDFVYSHSCHMVLGSTVDEMLATDISRTAEMGEGCASLVHKLLL